MWLGEKQQHLMCEPNDSYYSLCPSPTESLQICTTQKAQHTGGMLYPKQNNWYSSKFYLVFFRCSAAGRLLVVTYRLHALYRSRQECDIPCWFTVRQIKVFACAKQSRPSTNNTVSKYTGKMLPCVDAPQCRGNTPSKQGTSPPARPAAT